MNIVDELAELRRQMRGLIIRERALRAKLLAGEASLQGERHMVRIDRRLVVVPIKDERPSFIQSLERAKRQYDWVPV